FLFLLSLPPSRSTLFPYTTLFRSLLARAGNNRTAVPAVGQAGVSPVELGFQQPRSLLAETAKDGYVTSNMGNTAILGCLGEQASDRKSTRLNSSHQIISYAVFCLK